MCAIVTVDKKAALESQATAVPWRNWAVKPPKLYHKLTSSERIHIPSIVHFKVKNMKASVWLAMQIPWFSASSQKIIIYFLHFLSSSFSMELKLV